MYDSLISMNDNYIGRFTSVQNNMN